jgi:hypothetical protein
MSRHVIDIVGRVEWSACWIGLVFDPEDKDSTYLRNVRKLLPFYSASLAVITSNLVYVSLPLNRLASEIMMVFSLKL